MRGLWLKDFYVFINSNKMLIFFIAASTILGTVESSFLWLACPMFLASVMSINTMAYDERGHFDLYADTLPVTRKYVVVSKYVFPVFIMLAILALNIITGIIYRIIIKDSDIAALLLNSISAIVPGIISGGIIYPFIFKLGTEKGRIVYLCTAGVIVSFMLQLDEEYALNAGVTGTGVMTYAGVLTALLAAALLYIASMVISVRFYQKREL